VTWQNMAAVSVFSEALRRWDRVSRRIDDPRVSAVNRKRDRFWEVPRAICCYGTSDGTVVTTCSPCGVPKIVQRRPQ
jgi:hypothetical protein